MNRAYRMNAHGPPLDEDRQQSAHSPVPDDIEPLDEETLAVIAAVDRNADPVLGAIIRAALALAEEEERQDEERRMRARDGTTCPEGRRDNS